MTVIEEIKQVMVNKSSHTDSFVAYSYRLDMAIILLIPKVMFLCEQLAPNPSAVVHPDLTL